MSRANRQLFILLNEHGALTCRLLLKCQIEYLVPNWKVQFPFFWPKWQLCVREISNCHSTPPRSLKHKKASNILSSATRQNCTTWHKGGLQCWITGWMGRCKFQECSLQLTLGPQPSPASLSSSSLSSSAEVMQDSQSVWIRFALSRPHAWHR